MDKLLALYDSEGHAVQSDSLIFLGVTHPGVESVKMLMLRNISNEDVFNISVTSDNVCLKIENVPDKMEARGIAKLMIKHTPGRDAEKGIKANIVVKGVVWR